MEPAKPSDPPSTLPRRRSPRRRAVEAGNVATTPNPVRTKRTRKGKASGGSGCARQGQRALGALDFLLTSLWSYNTDMPKTECHARAPLAPLHISCPPMSLSFPRPKSSEPFTFRPPTLPAVSLPAPKRAADTPDHLTSRTKKHKLAHRYIRSPALLCSPYLLPSSSAPTSSAWFASCTALSEARETKMAPLEHHWVGDGRAWLAPGSASQLDNVQFDVQQLSISSRQDSVDTSGCADDLRGHAGLKAELMAILRSKIGSDSGGGKEASLKLRKWVVWNGSLVFSHGSHRLKY
jgi:hypothetical protein